MTEKSFDMSRVAQGLTLGEGGIWYGQSSNDLHYPDDGHETTEDLERDSFWYRHRLRCLVALVQRFPPDGPFFDVGGGTGYMAKGLQDAGLTTVLVEPGRRGAQSAAKRGVAQVVCTSVDEAGFSDKSLASIGLFDVLEHVDEDRQFLGLLHRKLTPGGRLFITVPSYSWLWSSHDDYMGHQRRYTKKTLAAVLHSAGFQPEYLSYFFSLLPLPIWMLRALPSRLGLRRHHHDTRKNDHQVKNSVLSKLIDWSLKWEAGAMSRGRSLPLGASLVCVARVRPTDDELDT